MLGAVEKAGKVTWGSCITEIIFQPSSGNTWLANEVGNANVFIHLFKTRFRDCAMQMQRRILTFRLRLHTINFVKRC